VRGGAEGGGAGCAVPRLSRPGAAPPG